MSDEKKEDKKIVILKEKSHDYKNNPKKKGDFILRQTYFKVVKDVKGKLMESTMEKAAIKDAIKTMTSNNINKSFSVAVYYENQGWLECSKDAIFNSDEDVVLHHEEYGDDTDYGDISDFIIYSYPRRELAV